MREDERKQKLVLQASLIFYKSKAKKSKRFSKILYKVSCRGLYTTKTIQITKLSKAINYYIGIIFEENKNRRQKVKKNGSETISQCENSQPFEILHPLRN